jgi:hypothetical protein
MIEAIPWGDVDLLILSMALVLETLKHSEYRHYDVDNSENITKRVQDI